MRVKKLLIILAVLFIANNAFCKGQQEGKSQSTTVRGGDKLFARGGTGSLTINNQASFDVVIFAGVISSNNVLGGIRAGDSRTFDISKLRLPSKNGSFLIRAASFDTYSKNNYRVTEEHVLYTGLVVYDLNNPRDAVNLNIFAGISQEQQECIYVSNTSKFVLELRLGNPNGEKLATLAPLQVNKPIFLSRQRNNMPYEFYATYVYVDPHTNEVKSFVAKDMSERQRRSPSADRVNPMVFDGPKDTSQITYLVSFLRIKNDTNESLNFQDGTTWLFDQKGEPLVESGQLMTFEIPAMSGDKGQPYSNLNMVFDSTKTLRMNRLDAKPGVVYDIIVTTRNGNPAYDIRPTEYKDKLEDLRVSLFLGD